MQWLDENIVIVIRLNLTVKNEDINIFMLDNMLDK